MNKTETINIRAIAGIRFVEHLQVVCGNIADQEFLTKHDIDTIVNAANPTLMGSNQGVDGAIHKAIRYQNKPFGELICEELQTSQEKSMIRCKRGEAVITGGYNLCKYVIHVVGAKNDQDNSKVISSSRIFQLENCYTNIIQAVKRQMNIRNIAIPIVGTGEYGMPFELGVRIAIASIGNALLEWRQLEPETFDMCELQNIYFVIHDSACSQRMGYAKEILAQYVELLKMGHRVSYLGQVEELKSYRAEIERYDQQKGYFSIAKGMRLGLILLRYVFLPFLLLKDALGKQDWEKQRFVAECITLVKAILPIVAYWFLTSNKSSMIITISVIVVMIYCLCDTVTYLLALIVLGDIQQPSANLGRSLLLLLINYMEISLEMSVLYYVNHLQNILYRDAVLFGVLGELSGKVEQMGIIDYMLKLSNEGIKFMFLSLIFASFVNQVRPRKFRKS
ncbi:MAG: macro domain-containing protein [Lachnospiraceae bacterium]|nr:macro domain-containing protein [Lachnospiraceae bacterium]